MNDFGVNLTGKQGIYKAAHFCKNATKEERTFMCESGPGCSPEKGTRRSISGYWVSDKMRDTIDSNELAFYIDDNGKEIPQHNKGIDETGVIIVRARNEVADPVVLPVPERPQPKRRAVSVPVETAPAAESAAPAETTAAVAATPAPASDGSKVWDAARAVELYKGGMKIIEIAVEMGYARGQGCNRTKAALKAAGVLNG